jgi:fatty acid desaturase
MEDVDRLKEVESSGPKRRGRGSGWVAGIGLILVGVVLLLANLTGFGLDNWWALFILIPAFGALGNAYRIRQQEGRFTREARGSVIGALILGFVASVFLLNLDFGDVWPVFLILAGLGALLNALLD